MFFLLVYNGFVILDLLPAERQICLNGMTRSDFLWFTVCTPFSARCRSMHSFAGRLMSCATSGQGQHTLVPGRFAQAVVLVGAGGWVRCEGDGCALAAQSGGVSQPGARALLLLRQGEHLLWHSRRYAAASRGCGSSCQCSHLHPETARRLRYSGRAAV